MSIDLEEVKRLVNKSLKGSKLSLANDPLASDVSEFFSTGWTLLDAALGGGLPVGRIVEVYGQESTAKTTLALHAVESAQKAGGVVIYLDTEGTFHKPLAINTGIDLSAVLINQDVTMEEIPEIVKATVDTVRKTTDAPILLVWDTLAATATTDEEAGATDGMIRAKKVRDWMRGINGYLSENRIAFLILNHSREVIARGPAGWGGPRYETSGGKGVAFASTARVMLKTGASITEDKKVVGSVIIGQVVKNKLAAPKTKVETHLYFGKGFSDDAAVFTYLKTQGIIEQRGAWAQLPTPKGDVVKTTAPKLAETLADNPGLREYLRTLAIETFKTVSTNEEVEEYAGLPEEK